MKKPACFAGNNNEETGQGGEGHGPETESRDRQPEDKAQHVRLQTHRNGEGPVGSPAGSQTGKGQVYENIHRME